MRLNDVRMEPSSGRSPSQLIAGEYVCLTTTYNSQGTTASDQTAAFVPRGTLPDGESQTGVGLAVVDGVVSSHGGAMRVSTETADGTSVEVYLPALKPGNMADVPPIWRDPL